MGKKRNKVVRFPRERRQPGEGWPQQEQFIRVIEKIGNEEDRLVRLLRALRMFVIPGGPISEEVWGTILLAAETVEDFHARRRPVWADEARDRDSEDGEGDDGD